MTGFCFVDELVVDRRRAPPAIEVQIAVADGKACTDDLVRQIAKHEQALNELEEGPRFIAAQTPVSADAVKHNRPEPPRNHYYVEEGPGQSQERLWQMVKFVEEKLGVKRSDLVDGLRGSR